MKKFVSLFLVLWTFDAVAGVGGNIGLADDRTYGSVSMPEYSAICRLDFGCTCGFIDNHLIVTNSHCARHCVGDKAGTCTASFWNGKETVKTSVDVIMFNPNFNVSAGDDWAFMFTHEGNPNTKNVASNTTVGTVNRGGYGQLRVIPDSELPILRRIFSNEAVHEQCNKQHGRGSEKAQSCFWKYLEAEVKKAGLKPLRGDGKNFKIQRCNINGDVRGRKNMVKTSCDSAGGDSGAPLFRGSTVVAVNNSGPQMLFAPNEEEGASAVKTENFYQYIPQAKNIVAQRLGQNASVPPVTVQPTQPGAGAEPVTNPNQMQQSYNQFLKDFQCD